MKTKSNHRERTEITAALLIAGKKYSHNTCILSNI